MKEGELTQLLYHVYYAVGKRENWRNLSAKEFVWGTPQVLSSSVEFGGRPEALT